MSKPKLTDEILVKRSKRRNDPAWIIEYYRDGNIRTEPIGNKNSLGSRISFLLGKDSFDPKLKTDRRK